MNKLLPLFLSLLCACEAPVTPPLEAFRILDIEPGLQVKNETKSVTVRLDVEPRFHVDYGGQVARMLEEPVLEISSESGVERVVPLDNYLGHGRFQGWVASGLPEGHYALRVKLGEGREATLPKAYEVKPPVDFWVEPIRNQHTKEPFTITLHASDPNGELFVGTVQVSIYTLDNTQIFTAVSGPFTAGVHEQPLTIDTSGEYLIVLQDELNRRSTSNAFRVLPKD
jgi:hypothetical protein